MAKVSLRAYNREIEAMIDRNHLDEAIAHCKHILKTFPKHLDTYRLLGKAYLEYKRYADAVDIFSRVLVAIPNDFVANVGMSIIRDEENRFDEAIWYMERAFETQPSNAAIQSELQRLYSRRDGVQLPRIRMTHGALAHMYVKGELHAQAISEIKNVLKEDPGRLDMQSLLARAYYHSGAKNEAAEAASAVLRSEPYSLDANRILVEILGAEHPENVQAYRQRVIELDPYAAQVSGSIFQADEVPDVAVTIERLDWNGQPVGLQPDWEAKQAISLESGGRSEEEPEWLKNTFHETPPLVGQPPFDVAPPSATPAQSADDIPDFLRAAGWGQSTGEFDESKPAFAESEPASSEEALAPGDLPDWVKAMAPEQSTGSPAEEGELPDWINKIDKSVLPATESTDQPDWMSQLEQPATQPAEDQPDWLKQFDSAAQGASTDDQPDWLKGFENEVPDSRPSTGELDWLSHLGEEAKPAETPLNQVDSLNPPKTEAESLAAKLDADDKELLKEFGFESEATPPASTTDEFDFLNELTGESEQLAPASASASEPSMQDNLGKSTEEQDDSFAWLESLAAKQGATEGLLTTPEERREEEPDWVKQAKGIDVPADQPLTTKPAANQAELGKGEQEQDDAFAWLESLAAKQGATEGLLTKPEERREEEPDWVKQAKATGDQPQEVQPEQAPQEMPATELEPAANVEELGRSEAEREDAFAWLESLAAKQGATEGLLTKPEERKEEEPEWVKHAKDVSAEQLSTTEPPSSVEDTAAWLRSLDEDDVSESPEAASPRDATGTWFKNLEEPDTQGSQQPAQQSQADELPPWMENLEGDRASETVFNLPSEDLTPSAPEAKEEVAPSSQTEDLPEWMQGIEEDRASETLFNISALGTGPQAPEAETTLPEKSVDLPEWMQGIEEDEARATDLNLPAIERSAERDEKEPSGVDTEWMSAIEQESVMEAAAVEEDSTKTPAEELPSWLSELDQAREQALTPGATDTDLPSWMRDETDKTSETVTESTKIEPTHASDWQPAETKQPEAQAPEPEPVMLQPETQAPPPEPAQSQAEIQTPEREAAEVVNIIEEKIAAVQGPVAPASPPRPPKLKGTGRLSMPPDPILGQARNELSGSNVSGALENYSRLIKKGRFLDEVIFDLRDATYRFPVDVDVWQSLGDAYMRANRLQDALDAYTKAEELLR
jgi:cytochrome c-type biogenesis protein CcmH/NrfG